MEFLDLIKTRKSIRSFSSKPVPRELIEKILATATSAPSNCNQQLWNFTVIEDAATKEHLIKEAAANTLIRRAPVVIVVSYDGWNYKEAIQGGTLATSYILLAATHYGLGSLPMNSYGADSKIKKILGLPKEQTICCFVLLGYPDEKALEAKGVPRRDAREVTHWGHFLPKEEKISYQYDTETWTAATLEAHQKYYCRKTFLGKEMDIMSDLERALVRRELQPLSGHVADFFSYDGAYLREFPEAVKLTTVDLCAETSDYSAAALTGKAVTSKVFGSSIPLSNKTNTLIFKLERLPRAVRCEMYKQMSGELLIISRRHNGLLSLFFWLLKKLFGSDVRKTGIYAFFGPYQPISLRSTLRELRQNGFTNIRWQGHFAIPAFFEQAYQMFLQYRFSEGSSYLHRERRQNFVTKIIAWVLQKQGLSRCGILGSVVVIRCQK